MDEGVAHGRRRHVAVRFDTKPKDLLIESPEGPHRFHVTYSKPGHVANIDGQELYGQIWCDHENEAEFFTSDDATTFHQLHEGALTEAHVMVYVAEDAGALTWIQTFINTDRVTGRGWFVDWGCWFNMELRNDRWVQTDCSPAYDIPHACNYYVFHFDETAERWRLYENVDNIVVFQDLKPIGYDSNHYICCDGDNVPYALCLQSAEEETDIGTYVVTALEDGFYIAVEPRNPNKLRWLAYSPTSGWRVQKLGATNGVCVDEDFEVEVDDEGKPIGAIRRFPLQEGSFFVEVGDEDA